MTQLFIRYRITSNHHSDFLEVINTLCKEIQPLKSVIAHDLSQCQEESENFIQKIRLELSGSSKENIAYYILGLLGKFKENILEMRYYSTVGRQTVVNSNPATEGNKSLAH